MVVPTQDLAEYSFNHCILDGWGWREWMQRERVAEGTNHTFEEVDKIRGGGRGRWKFLYDI